MPIPAKAKSPLTNALRYGVDGRTPLRTRVDLRRAWRSWDARMLSLDDMGEIRCERRSNHMGAGAQRCEGARLGDGDSKLSHYRECCLNHEIFIK
jgi:hypothetical protein